MPDFIAGLKAQWPIALVWALVAAFSAQPCLAILIMALALVALPYYTCAALFRRLRRRPWHEPGMSLASAC